MTEDSIPPAAPEPQDTPPAPRRMERLPQGRILAGVCTGLGRYTGIDPVVFRVGFGLLVIANGWGFPLYIAAALLMPGDPARPAPAEKLFKRRFDGDAVLAILGLLLTLGVLVSLPGQPLGSPVTAVVVLALALLVAQIRGVDLVQLARTLPERLQGTPPEAFPPPPPAPPSSWDRLPPGAIDLAVLNRAPRRPDTPEDTVPPFAAAQGARPYGPAAAAGFWGYDPATASHYVRAAGRAEPRIRGLSGITIFFALVAAAVAAVAVHDRPGYPTTEITLAAALAVIGLGLVVTSWYGRNRGLFAIGALLSVGLVATSVPSTMGLTGGRFGDVTWRPAEAGSGEQTYKVIAGDGRLDLTRLPLHAGQRVRIRVELGAGQIRITVPANALVELHATAGLGDIVVEHRITSGPKAKLDEVLTPEVAIANPPVIELHVRGRLGDVEVRRG